MKMSCALSGAGLRSVEIVIDDDLDRPRAAKFLEWLVEQIGAGTELAAGQSIRYGWFDLRCEIEDRILRLRAPDLLAMPIVWQASMSAALRTTAQHVAIPRSLGLEPDIPSLGQYAVVGDGFETLPMFMERTGPGDADDSGWALGSARIEGPDPVATAHKLSLYELVVAAPRLLPYLSMPPGSDLLFRDDRPTLSYQGRPLKL
jgi:hypothetical protein